ncbi:MAG: pyridoxal phosphate-dependent aminotransferase [Proteobacteria bacterium]|nr:pyridoxal phosphate-dependent aminotransferase [Pseudomonadota bacterium]
MRLSIGKRTVSLIQSEIRNMSIECDRMGGINLSQGICDMELPKPVLNGAFEAMRQGENHYTRYDGLDCLRQAISRKMSSYNRIDADPERNIVVSSGATGAFYCTCLALLNPGDEVIVFEPYYGYHLNTLLAANAVPVFVTLEPPEWTFDVARLEESITDKTKGILVNTPANPSGKVFSFSELEKIAALASKHRLFLFTDEIYEYFLYDGLTHVSPGSFKNVADQTITISGYSKTFSITGWRVGYAVCHEKWAKMIGYISDLVYVCAPAPLQVGVARGISELPEYYYSDLCGQYSLKRELICNALNKIGIRPHIPQGAYYVLADVSSIPGRTSKDKAMYILDKTGVASVPGSAFYASGQGENLVRFCFAKSNAILEEACSRLSRL